MPPRDPPPPANWPFDQPPNAAAITLRRIVLPARGQQPRPILRITHDLDDHGWQFLDGDAMTMDDAAIVGMQEILNQDPSVAEVADMPPGWTATRTAPGAPWKRTQTQS